MNFLSILLLTIILLALFVIGGIVYYGFIKKRWRQGNQFIYRGKIKDFQSGDIKHGRKRV